MFERSCDPAMASIQCKSSLMNMNVNIIISILFPSTTAAPATSILTSCEAVWFGAPGKRQRVTEAKGCAVVLRCVSGKRPVSSAVIYSKTK